MPTNDVLTMWGPPGTGKTKVLTALIAMALKNNKTVHVCAKSNAAIDEILNRIHDLV
jgi:ATP-dependent RNA/DNA helicase IGHMBP2